MVPRRTRILACRWAFVAAVAGVVGLNGYHLEQRESGQYEIVRLVGELGPSAREAVPILRHLRYSRAMMMHDYAIDALGRHHGSGKSRAAPGAKRAAGPVVGRTDRPVPSGAWIRVPEPGRLNAPGGTSESGLWTGQRP
jgi:hypothetical protein